MLNVALPKGRLGEKVYAMFEAAGFECPSIKENNRKLIFENEEKQVRYFWVKPSDVAIYVERGAADIGVAGKDILLEYNPDIYELLDLNLDKVGSLVGDDEVIGEVAAVGAVSASQNAADAVAALVSLGYSQSEASLAVGRLDSQLSVEELIKSALKAMSKF